MNLPFDSLRKRTQRALVWSATGTYGSSVLHLGALLALGALLPPTDFGLLALGLVAVTLGEGIGNLGLPTALVQRKSIDQRTLDSAFWCVLLVHVILAGAVYFGSDSIARTLGDPACAPLVRLLSLVFVPTAISMVPRTLLTRSMKFRSLSMAQFAGEFGFATAGLVLAALGYGVWSLGVAVLAQRSLIAMTLWRFSDYRPGGAIDISVLRDLIRFGAPVMGGNLTERVLIRVDYFVIGRFVGTEALGYYSLALQLSLIPLQRLVGLVQTVAFPAFSIVQDDLVRLRKGVLEGLHVLLTVVLPLVLAIVFCGPWFLQALYGDKWAESIGPLRILAAAGVFLLPRLFESAFLAVGKPNLRLALAVFRLLVFLILVPMIGIGSGINGVALCLALSLLLWAGAHLAIGARLLTIPMADLAAAASRPLRAGALSLAPMAVFLFVPAGSFSPWLALAYSSTSLLGIYALLTLPDQKSRIKGWWSAWLDRPAD